MHQSASHPVLQRHGITEESGHAVVIVNGQYDVRVPCGSSKSLLRAAFVCNSAGSSAFVAIELNKNAVPSAGSFLPVRVRARQGVKQKDWLSISGATIAGTKTEVVYGGKTYSHTSVGVQNASQLAVSLKALIEADGHSATERTTANAMGGAPQTYLEVQNKAENVPAAISVTVTKAAAETLAVQADRHALIAVGVALALDDKILLDTWQTSGEKGYQDLADGDVLVIRTSAEGMGVIDGGLAFSLVFCPPMDDRRTVKLNDHIATEIGRNVPERKTW